MMERREFTLMILGGGALGIAGCSKNPIEMGEDVAAEIDQNAEAVVAELETETIESTKVVLYGFMITSFVVGTSIRFLPEPAVRVVGVVLFITNQGARIVIQYLDEELKRREHSEDLSDQEARKIEEARELRFRLDNGEEESVLIGPTEYHERSAAE